MRQGISRHAAKTAATQGAAFKGAAAIAALLSLAGCTGGGMGSLISGGSGAAQPVASGQAAGQAVGQAGTVPGQDPSRDLVCPYVDIRDGAAAHRVYAGQPSNESVRYQFSMGDIARDCRVAGNQLILKIGVEGRVLLGPAGSPSSFTVPVTIAVRDESNMAMVANRSYKVAASIGQGSTGTAFTVVSDEIAVPFKSLQGNLDYQVFVGFDGASSAASNQPSRRRR
ncbi:MAG: hypothetical protein K2Y29_07945 [Beijerinckiaceae bacterium]|nr:hypothetical protein [Beijerinckiaceae bacterium]